MLYHRDMQLLLVEDDLEIQTFLRHALAEAGYQVDAAPDAKTAERMATESQARCARSWIWACRTRMGLG